MFGHEMIKDQGEDGSPIATSRTSVRQLLGHMSLLHMSHQFGLVVESLFADFTPEDMFRGGGRKGGGRKKNSWEGGGGGMGKENEGGEDLKTKRDTRHKMRLVRV